MSHPARARARPVAGNRRAATPEARADFDTLVIGAGQAGLAAGYFLARAGLRFGLLDAGDAIGASWQQRWDSLRLFTPARYNALPGLPFPGEPYALPDKDAVAAYLNDYVRRFALPVRLGTAAQRLLRNAGAVVWCTGFRPDFGWIELPVLGLDGDPMHRRGVADGLPGLAFLGLRYQYRMGSALLGGVGEDADHVTGRIIAHVVAGRG